MEPLFTPLQVGDIALANRVVMAPLTRNRAPGQVPTALMAEYYRQRAHPATGAGLIVTEATPISPMAHGYLDTPGLHTAEQVAAWKAVTAAVHAEGGRIVTQLWHVGRISHTSLLPGGAAPQSSTTRAARTKTYIAGGFAPVSEPRALATEELPGIVEQYRQAALNAMEAGFDGVEIHAANGYLLEQFLKDSANDRSDAYGGSISNRCRLTLEVTRAITGAIGGGRTGIRLSPITPANDIGQDSDPQALYTHLVAQLAPLGLAYIHVVEGATGGPRDLSDQGVPPFDYAALKALFPGRWMVNNGYTREMALAATASGAADLVAFGKAFIANPDLGRRLREDAPWNALDMKTLYGGGAAGYTDYPAL
ncbi:alkene reductase [Ideonella sp. 4Y16]|uniref:alkene reductase n=1 Tax=Ideonella alba TaxID=2824118 RepID=UPI001B37DADB|nr:alkene reductase [Ideonella alba]MBQ0942906.1 alkene reductase [Ideonella alba]